MGKAKTIEERYQKKSQLEHILLRPDTYIGSTEMNTQQMWVFDAERRRMVHENVDYVPGLYKIFDELLVNAADVYARQLSDPTLEKMTCIKVTIDRETGAIVVYNDGEPIPIQIHAEHQMYVPQLIFGELLTSDNYDDSEERVTGGRNGFGAKLANIFSKTFTVVVGNKRMRRRFKMTWCDNMRKTKGPAKVEPYQGPDFVKITFLPDYERFNLKQMDEGTYRVLQKRVYDIAGTTTVKVYLNGERIKIKDFKEYVNLYLPEENEVKVHEKMFRWEVVVSSSEEGFRQVSFVNSINTIKGGTHVSHVVDPLVQSLARKVNSKNKGGIELKPNQIKSHIFVFINCQVVNPSFDSQTKETLTTKTVKFGSKYTMSDRALAQVLRSKIVDNILSWLHERTNIELKRKMKVSSKGSDRLFGIPKLEDANKAGTRHSAECTLILTEGDSAKTSCLAGLSVVGRDRYGVFPLKGKLLNVREASYKQLTQNVEVQNILKIMGLDISNRGRQDATGLRYGSVMIMTDQDYDGSHIKGLLINLFHNFWPKLIQFGGFIREFVTPLIKATSKSGQVLSFFTMEDFNRWKQTADMSSYKIKYYKGLGTSSDKEFKEYFSNLSQHQIEFKYVDERDDDCIDMAFSKKRIEDRKQWMQSFALGNTVDHSVKKLRYADFINKELIQFSIYDTERSIPSVIDGFKPGQRKVLFGCFKRNLRNECKVAQLTGYIAEHSAYHHGENSLQQTIVNMAQDFVGSNNLNLLLPCGQFGSRKEGGKDAAAARYIFTKLSPLTRHVFLQDDDPILDYQNEEGQLVEPFYYLPIIPMVLVNGSEGIGTGFSTNVPCYNPIDVIENIRNYLRNEEMFEMVPWYRGFRGTIERNSRQGFDVLGRYKLSEDSRRLQITELPINRWINDYREFLNGLAGAGGKGEEEEGYITDYSDFSSNELIDIRVNLNPSAVPEILREGVEKVFKLRSSISTTNMTLFDSSKRIRRYESELEILKEFIGTRVKSYNRRREHLIKQLQLQLQQLSNQVRFINMVINNELVLFRKPKLQIVAELKRLQFDPVHTGAGREEGYEELHRDAREERDELLEREGYNYLLNMSLLSLSSESIAKLNGEYNAKQLQLKNLINTSSLQLYEQDLDELRSQLLQTKLYPPTNREQIRLNKQRILMFKSREAEAAQEAAAQHKHQAKQGKRREAKEGQVGQDSHGDKDGQEAQIEGVPSKDGTPTSKYNGLFSQGTDAGGSERGASGASPEEPDGSHGLKGPEGAGLPEGHKRKGHELHEYERPEDPEKPEGSDGVRRGSPNNLFRMDSIEQSQIENVQYSQISNNDPALDNIRLSQLETSQLDAEDEPERESKYSVSLIDRLNKKFNSNVLSSLNVDAPQGASTAPEKKERRRQERAVEKKQEHSAPVQRRRLNKRVILSSEEEADGEDDEDEEPEEGSEDEEDGEYVDGGEDDNDDYSEHARPKKTAMPRSKGPKRESKQRTPAKRGEKKGKKEPQAKKGAGKKQVEAKKDKRKGPKAGRPAKRKKRAEEEYESDESEFLDDESEEFEESEDFEESEYEMDLDDQSDA